MTGDVNVNPNADVSVNKGDTNKRMTGNITIGHRGFLNFGKINNINITNKINDLPFIKFLRDITRIKPMRDFLKTIESPDQTVKECWENKIKKIEKGEINYAALWAEAENDVKEGKWPHKYKLDYSPKIDG